MKVRDEAGEGGGVKNSFLFEVNLVATLGLNEDWIASDKDEVLTSDQVVMRMGSYLWSGCDEDEDGFLPLIRLW